MADRVSARRAVANGFFLATQSTLVALVGAASTDSWALALPGLILAIAWWLLLRSYRVLNTAKFKVIEAMERRLPAAPFQAEWDELKPQDAKSWHRRYFELGLLERTVPAVYGTIFLVALVLDVV